MKYLLLILAAINLTLNAQLTNLGKITVTTSLVWDKNPELDIVGYYVYARSQSDTNNFYRVPTTTNGITAQNLIGTNSNGNFTVYATAVNSVGLESAPSLNYSVGYAITNITSPKNFQLFLFTIATNLIPLQQIK
jgi:hypothetical protein